MMALLPLALAQIAIALSVFSLITYLWLGLTVLLIGDRRSLITWGGGLGLLSASVFFLCHGALVGAGVPDGPSPSDFWWHLSWVPAFAAPLFWSAIGMHYAGLARVWRRQRSPALLSLLCLGALTGVLALVNWPAIAHYGDFIRLLDRAVRLHGPALPTSALPGVPALGLAFVIYISACACVPWAALVMRRLLPPAAVPANGANADATLLWNPRDAWSRARPAMLAASVCMMGAGAVVALIGILSLLAERRSLLTAVAPDLPRVPAARPGHVPLLLVAADLAVQVALALLGLMVGWAVVRQGVLVERRLPQRGYLSHWRGMAALAGVLASVIAAMAAVVPESLPSLLVLVALVSAAFALFTWQSYGAHDKMLMQLRPFITSMTAGHTGWLSTDAHEVERTVEALFTSLCRDVLGAASGRLALSAGRLHRTFLYQAPPQSTSDVDDLREWALPVMDERGVVARLVLGPRADGSGYTSADLEVARACGQRILDAVGEFASAQAIASLARQRGLESELSAALPRRVLHDEVLPRLHLAMLHLEALRAQVPIAAAPALVGGAEHTAEREAPGAEIEAGIAAVVGELGKAHRDLAALMRAAPIVNQRHLEHGLVSALRAALDGQFRGTFDRLDWQADEGACQAADALPAIVADLLLGATLEAVRNAGRHARGGDLHRRLRLGVHLSADEQTVTVSVADDGVGLQTERAVQRPPALPPDVPVPSLLPASGAEQPAPTGIISSTTSTRTGLLTHGALMALIGGSLSVHSAPTGGTTVTIQAPRTRMAGLT